MYFSETENPINKSTLISITLFSSSVWPLIALIKCPFDLKTKADGLQFGLVQYGEQVKQAFWMMDGHTDNEHF